MAVYDSYRINNRLRNTNGENAIEKEQMGNFLAYRIISNAIQELKWWMLYIPISITNFASTWHPWHLFLLLRQQQPWATKEKLRQASKTNSFYLIHWLVCHKSTGSASGRCKKFSQTIRINRLLTCNIVYKQVAAWHLWQIFSVIYWHLILEAIYDYYENSKKFLIASPIGHLLKFCDQRWTHSLKKTIVY